MPENDFVRGVLARFSNAFHFVLDGPDPLGAWVFLQDRGKLLTFLATEVNAEHAGVPVEHQPAVVAEVAKPRRDDELLMFDVRDGVLEAALVDRARIDRELRPKYVVDARNHFPMPWPTGWHGPYALHIPETYRIDTPGCQVLARVEEAWDYEDLDDEGTPRHLWRLEIGVTRAMDSALPTDEQIAEVTARFRSCGAWVDVTESLSRRHPSRRVFHAEIGNHPQGTPWPKLQPLPDLLGPPPGWEPVGSLEKRPLVFRIEGTELRVEWSPPAGADQFAAATGRLTEPSRFTVSARGRKPSDEEVGIVFAMLGGAAYTERKGARPLGKGKEKARVFLATAGWLRTPAGRA